MVLRDHLQTWRDIGANDTILDWIEYGIHIPFVNEPQSFEQQNHTLNAKESNFVDNELSDLLLVNAIERLDYRPKCVSPLGVVPKKNNKLRLIHDLRVLNDCCRPSGFQYEDIRSVSKCVQAGDSLITLDIKNGFHHVSVHESDRDYLGFCWRGVYYRWCVLPFGLSCSPYFFGKCLKPVVKYLRSLGIRLVLYVDDFLVIARDADIVSHRDKTIRLLESLGWSINWDKSDTDPSYSKLFLGYIINCENDPYLLVPKDKCVKIKKDIRRILAKDTVNARVLARTAGLCVSVVRAIGPGRLMLRGVYRLLRSREHWGSTLDISQDARADLQWWFQALDYWNGYKIKVSVPKLQIITDASPWGYGAVCEGHEASGFWTECIAQMSQNYRELMAILVSLETFSAIVAGKAVHVLTDNFSAMTYINHGGGPSAQLTSLAKAVWYKAHQLGVELSAGFLAGQKNTHADRLSRLPPRYEWSLSRRAFTYIDHIWGPHTVDRFASYTNAQVPVFNTRFWEPRTAGVNALAQEWSGENNWVNAPFRLLHQVLDKIVQCRAEATVIAPFWPSQTWFRRLLTMATQRPIRIPKTSLMINVTSSSAEVLHNPRWRLYAWRLSGTKCSSDGDGTTEHGLSSNSS